MTDVDRERSAPETSDEDLIDRVRAGDIRAFGVLWERHAGPARSVARTFTDLDADDIVSEAFERLLVAMQKGKGPRGAFRPYLIMTVRNVGRRQYNRELPRHDADFDLMVDGSAPNGEHAAIRQQQHRTAGEAFASLPARWQAALWYSEVDGMQPREMSGPLGLSANAASALVLRAKRGFRDAWVSAQLSKAGSQECQAALVDIGPYTRDGLSARASARLEKHIDSCESCTAALVEARGIARTLGLVILPLVAGTAGAMGYLATMRPPAVPEMQLPVATAASAADGVVEVAHPIDSSHRTRIIVAGVLLLAVGMGAGAIALNSLSPIVPVAEDGGPAFRPTATATALEPLSTPTPTPPPTPPSVPLFPEPDAPVVSPSPSIRNVPGPVQGPPILPPLPDTPPALEPDSPAPQGVPPRPVLTLDQPDQRMYPRVGGDTAVPGAILRVTDASGEIVGETTADRRGDWSLRIASARTGIGSATVTQTVDGVTSAVSDPVAFEVQGPPSVASPTSGDVVDGERFQFQLDGAPGTVLQRDVLGQTPVQTFVIPESGEWNEYLRADSGPQTLRIRYATADGRNYGPWTQVEIIAE